MLALPAQQPVMAVQPAATIPELKQPTPSSAARGVKRPVAASGSSSASARKRKRGLVFGGLHGSQLEAELDLVQESESEEEDELLAVDGSRADELPEDPGSQIHPFPEVI